MATVFLIHGAYGNDHENWLPYLKAELEKRGCRVYVPLFPTPKNQTLQNWLSVFKDYEKYIGPDTIFVGHSLGPAFILALLERLSQPVKACFLVASFLGEIGNPDFDTINKSFVQRDFDWQKIKKKLRPFPGGPLRQ
jgi:predicted alpha/beta hydrolase family esterase